MEATSALDMRVLMGQWATGVSILTAEDGDGPKGCTANAVSSLSLDPMLLIACFAYSSNTLEAVRRSGRFAVNILAADQEDVSRRFATKAGSKFEGLPFTLVGGTPVIEGALAWVVCDVEQEVAGGDHAIMIGAPRWGEARDGAEPLVYFRSKYARVAT